MAVITPITKDDLRAWGIKFILIDVPTFAINLQKNCKTNRFLFKTKEEAKAFVEEKQKLIPIIVYDVEKVHKEKATRESKFVTENSFYLQIADINNIEFTKIYENIKNTTDTIFTFNWDFSNSNLK